MFLRVSTVFPKNMKDNIRELPHRAILKNERHGVTFQVNRTIMPSASLPGVQEEPKPINLSMLKALTVLHHLRSGEKESKILRHYIKLENQRGDWEDYGFLLLDLKCDSLLTLSMLSALWTCPEDKLMVQIEGNPRVIGRAVCPGDCKPPRYFPSPFENKSPTKEQIQRGFANLFGDAAKVARELRRTIGEHMEPSLEQAGREVTDEYRWYKLISPILQQTDLAKLLVALGVVEVTSLPRD